MQSLTDAVKARYPGVTVYGIGDAAHKLRSSDHNEDDTSGSRAAQSDADSNPEHRAIDIMLGPNFTRMQAYELIEDLLAPVSRARLFYVLFDGWRWSRSTDWHKVPFDGDPHDDHIHVSGWAADDENAAGWPAVNGGEMELTDKVKYVQGAGVSYSQPETTVGTMLGQTLYYLLYTRNQVLALQKDVAELKARPAADVDEAALAAALSPLIDAGATPAEVAAAVRAELDKTRLGGS
jgi:hypothetical protein